ncbi:MAG: CRTAC1 family protein [Planctomycetota bacterium]|nr:CRTAC1 family protein [Planctomycetota bacterium]
MHRSAQPQEARKRRQPRTVALLAGLLLGAWGGKEATQDPAATSGPQQPAGHRQMVEALAGIAARTDDEHPYLGSLELRGLRDQLAELGDRSPTTLCLKAGIAELQQGNERAGIELLERARDQLAKDRGPNSQNALASANFFLGVGYLRLGETQNCCRTNHPDSCIVPFQEGALHQDPEGSTKAAEAFLAVVENTPAQSYWHLAARWLLNIAHLTLGSHPDGVPEAHRIPASAFAPTGDFPRLANVAGALGLDTFSLSGGVIVDDFDNDGLLDVLTSTWDCRGQLRLFRNNGDGSFTDRTAAAGLQGLLGGLNLVQADYDNDDDLDFLVLRGAWLFENGRHPNSLVRNNGDGTFTDVTFEAGLGAVHYPTQTAAWADFDADGDLDLYIGNESSQGLGYPCQLFRNEGDGRFTDIASSAGVENYSYCKGVTWGDYDGDGLPDLYVSNNGSPNRLYHNKGDGTFDDVAESLGVSGPNASFPVWFWDYDNDGALDLFVSGYGTGIGHVAAYYLGLETEPYELARLYRGDGQGGFSDTAEEVGLDYPSLPMGSNFGDINNDGWLDFYLGTGDPHYYSLMPNLLFLNEQGRSFADVTMASGLGHLQKGHAIAFADLDNDGDLDLFEQMGGAYPGDGFHDALYENPGFGNRWIRISLRGTESNRRAIGARIRVLVQEKGKERSIYRHVDSGGSFGANPLRRTIGLGQADAISAIEVYWPTTGKTQRIEEVPLDRSIRIVEGRPGFTEEPAPAFRFRTR